MAEAHSNGFEQLLEHLRQVRGFEFSAYKRSSLERRINKRLQTLSMEGYANYLDYLEVHPEEFGHLFNTILINVSDFLRDPESWEAISQEVFPRILAAKEPADSIRVWSAGCASGQEPYTVAMLLCQLLGEEQFRQRVKIYATDVDEESLNEARLAVYSEQQVNSVPADLREQFFESANGRFTFRKELRRSIIFGRHNLLQDAPISRVDLIICRNTLMYFNAEAQARVLARFEFALKPGGFLFLGKAELMLNRINAFLPLNIKRRIFVKPRRERLAEPVPLLAPAGPLLPDGDDSRLRALALDLDPVPQIVLDRNGGLVVANLQARGLVGVAVSDVGQRMRELPSTYRPVDLRRLTEQSLTEGRVVTLKEVEWLLPGGEKIFLDVIAVPIPGQDDELLGVKLIFNDVTANRRLQNELHRSQQELETANEELQTTNEELQSTVEELETTNEELQSTNEELETMNEELQSTNEEMETTNTELQKRGGELNSLNAFLESIMANLRDGVVVLSHDLEVRAWNARSEDLWGLRAEEVRGRHFLGLDIGLPVDRLKPLIRATLSGDDVASDKPLLLDATNRRGKPISLRVVATRLAMDGTGSGGIILMMQETRPDSDGSTP